MKPSRFQLAPKAARRALALAAGCALLVAGVALADPHHGDGGGNGGGHGGGWGHGGGGPRGGGAPPGWSRGGGPHGHGGGPPGGGWGRGGPQMGPWGAGPTPPEYAGHWYPGSPGPSGHAWRRGGYLPPVDQSFVVGEYWRYHLRRPPAGYHWVQIGDEFMLISSSTGMIFDVSPAF